MGFWSFIARAAKGDFSRVNLSDDSLWMNGVDNSLPTTSGIQVNQQTALNVSAVLACATILSEDFAKLKPLICKREADGSRTVIKKHYLAKLLKRPNDWQSGFEFREMMQLSLVLRGNAYALIVRNLAHLPVKLVPLNSDRVGLWEAPNGLLYYRVTPMGLHEMSQFLGQPLLIPAEDVLHIRGFSATGLLGASRITLAREAVGLALGYERQAASWMGNGSRPSGLLTTDQKMSPEAAKRIAEDWKSMNSGLGNAGRTVVLEQGLKFEKISLSASDLEFIASRKFQLEEVARLFRVPPHKVGILDRSTNNNIAQQSQDYINDTLTSYTSRWGDKLEDTFNLSEDGSGEDIFIDWDYTILSRADLTTRSNYYRTNVMSGIMTQDEARIDDGRKPMGGEAGKLHFPTNMAAAGSQSTGTKADNGGRPPGSGNDENAEATDAQN